ncbi:FadR/GntR family transcriptional regulator [Rhodoferax mekongensis]|uniref:FadR/GntR family transcriptional regulator n=1 Tax=Rhodoferax mekongensis TaxID=3068341 RepID=A0ABZ0AZJ3_9BURK|nr:FadR/GntR family transcriptional regulator [Rhodoferax sp. TBRC 17307]WNO05083.1 FadR/GntR family transcriptional regulator [Rhodoferax sp. TBRC 17307]
MNRTFSAPHTTYTGRKLHGQVVQELGRRVVGGQYPADKVLPNEELLCQELAVSRTALREAVKVLAAKGLLEARPRIGTRVRTKDQWNLLDPDILAWRCATGVDADFLRHLTELREIIEPSAAALAATSRSPEQLESIAQALRTMETASTIAQWVQADLEFHTAVLKATNNPLLMPLAAIIGSALESLLGVTARTSDNFKQALPDHQKVFDAIRLQEPQNALHRMAGMLSDTRSLIRATIQPET